MKMNYEGVVVKGFKFLLGDAYYLVLDKASMDVTGLEAIEFDKLTEIV